MKFDEKWMPKGHPKSLKIDALGALGADFYDFYDFWQGPFFLCIFIQQRRCQNAYKFDFLGGLGRRGPQISDSSGIRVSFFDGRGEGGDKLPSWLDTGFQA